MYFILGIWCLSEDISLEQAEENWELLFIPCCWCEIDSFLSLGEFSKRDQYEKIRSTILLHATFADTAETPNKGTLGLRYTGGKFIHIHELEKLWLHQFAMNL